MEDFVVVDTPATIAPAALTLSVSAEKDALCAGEVHTTLAMISLAASAHEPKTRLPLEIVAVVDRSGSMHGAKIAVMKQTLSFLVSKGLQSGDSLAMVSFDDTVETRLPLSTMDAGGKSRAIEAINALQPGRTTNLSGGLLQGIDLLQRAPLPTGGSTRAVLLFTDGIANGAAIGVSFRRAYTAPHTLADSPANWLADGVSHGKHAVGISNLCPVRTTHGRANA